MSSILEAIVADLPDLSAGLCKEIDPDLWYPEKGGPTQDAKQVCRRCPVQLACLQYALDNDERFGVWGGFSERERRLLHRGRSAA